MSNVFEVQVGKGDKGSYKTRYTFTNDRLHDSSAMLYYSSINIGPGFKKRLRVNGKVIYRQFG